MSTKNEPEIVLNKSKSVATVKVYILESRALLYGSKVMELKKGETMEVSQELKDRLVKCKAAKVL